MSAKWLKGEAILDPERAVLIIMNGGTIFHNHKPQNPGWSQNWSVSQIRREALSKRLFEAIPAKEEAK